MATGNADCNKGSNALGLQLSPTKKLFNNKNIEDLVDHDDNLLQAFHRPLYRCLRTKLRVSEQGPMGRGESAAGAGYGNLPPANSSSDMPRLQMSAGVEYWSPRILSGAMYVAVRCSPLPVPSLVGPSGGLPFPGFALLLL